ncbi:helix-turn-helix transcriptional regulator [Brevibacillus sp. Leaf182]|uniref:ArsR/SmtB family transcription factor n=1 Tax=Brevibacillus sp. Leaf182 TaxID=1736290 RepID=UPI000A94105D|nr:metalloregulator ArsR/SmtB family transcription factor [Brevibacillus sp. Leaf182]
MQFNEVQSFLKALASEKRQEIMFLFTDRKELTVGEVAHLVAIGQSTASEQLAILKRAGLVHSRKDGKEVFYSPNREQILASMQKLNTYLLNCCK